MPSVHSQRDSFRLCRKYPLLRLIAYLTGYTVLDTVVEQTSVNGGYRSPGRYPIWISVTDKVFMNDSQAALSHGLPLRDMLMVMPLTWSRSV
jgi:hypothetical protein